MSCAKKETAVSDHAFISRDLAKIKWIEGHWEGDYHGDPFYETYRLKNDSTVLIKLYHHVGTDSATVEYDSIYWKKDAFYMGAAPNYKVTRIDDKSIKMDPLKEGSNTVEFTHVNDTTWIALLKGPQETVTYTMQTASALDSLLSSIK